MYICFEPKYGQHHNENFSISFNSTSLCGIKHYIHVLAICLSSLWILIVDRTINDKIVLVSTSCYGQIDCTCMEKWRRNLASYLQKCYGKLLVKFKGKKSIYGKVYEKRDLACIIKKYNKNALRLICYNFRTVNAINFLFSTLHTTPFLYGKIHFGVLHFVRVSIATFDTPLGSNPP